jgi:hypothetical protein
MKFTGFSWGRRIGDVEAESEIKAWAVLRATYPGTQFTRVVATSEDKYRPVDIGADDPEGRRLERWGAP